MKLDVNLCNNLKSIRTRLGISQQDLANITGVKGQSIGGIESGQYAPSIAMPLRLAKALGCQVENLFWFEEDLPQVEAVLTTVESGQQLPELRVSLARVGSQWMVYPLIGNGMHLYDSRTGEHNIPFVRKALDGKSEVLMTLGVWKEGLLVPLGNSKGIKTVTDLVKLEITIINREPGSGSRMLEERKLQEEQVALHTVIGFDNLVYNHQDVALSVVSGMKNAGVSLASVATDFSLGFIPLH